MIVAPEAVNVVPEPDAVNVAPGLTVNAPLTCDGPEFTVSDPAMIEIGSVLVTDWTD